MFYLIFIVSYLLGSINFAIIIAKYKGIDIQNEGSGNPGSSNALRVLGKKYALGVLIGDMLKGALCVFLGLHYIDSVNPIVFGLASVIGHCFPLYYRFKGGKGVATFLGTYLGYLVFVPSESYSTNFKILIFVSLLATFVLIAKVFRVSAIASLITVIISSYFIISEKSDLFVNMMTVLIVLIIIFQHRTNIRRLIEGRENKF